MTHYLSTELPSTGDDILVYFDRESGKIEGVTTADKEPIISLDADDVQALEQEVLCELDCLS